MFCILLLKRSRDHEEIFEGHKLNNRINKMYYSADEYLGAKENINMWMCLTPGHFYIGGKLLVNYWPESKNRTAYIAGTKYGFYNMSLEMAVNLSLKEPYIQRLKVKRKKQGFYYYIKKELFKKIKNCKWCNTPLTMEMATLEHVIPLKRGGLDNKNNMTLACWSCNKKRGCNMPELFNKVINK